MDPRIKRKVDELAELLKESDVLKALREARDELSRHEAAKIMLRDLQAKQRALQQKILRGEEPGENEVADYQRAFELAGFNPYVRSVVEAEIALGEILMYIQQRVDEVLAVVQDDGETAGGASGAEENKMPRSRLWVPGSP